MSVEMLDEMKKGIINDPFTGQGDCRNRNLPEMVQMEVPDWNLERLEKEWVLNCLRAHGYHRGKTAAALGISVRAIQRKLVQWKLRGIGLFDGRASSPEKE